MNAHTIHNYVYKNPNWCRYTRACVCLVNMFKNMDYLVLNLVLVWVEMNAFCAMHKMTTPIRLYDSFELTQPLGILQSNKVIQRYQHTYTCTEPEWSVSEYYTRSQLQFFECRRRPDILSEAFYHMALCQCTFEASSVTYNENTVYDTRTNPRSSSRNSRE